MVTPTFMNLDSDSDAVGHTQTNMYRAQKNQDYLSEKTSHKENLKTSSNKTNLVKTLST